MTHLCAASPHRIQRLGPIGYRSSPHVTNLKMLFKRENFSSLDYHVGSSIAEYVREEVFRHKSEGLLTSQKIVHETARSEPSVVESADSKIRYVAGWYIAKLLYKYRCQLQSIMQSRTSNFTKYKEVHRCVDLLEYLKVINAT